MADQIEEKAANKVEAGRTEYSKGQILKSKEFSGKADIINALWTGDTLKTKKEINDMIDIFMKGEVK